MKIYIAFITLLIIALFTMAPSFNPGGQVAQPSPVATTSGASFFYHSNRSGVSTLEAPSNSNRALIQALGGDLRWYALSGVSPTRDQGFKLVEDEYLELYSRGEVENFRWNIDKNSTGVTLQVLHEVQ